MAIKIIVSGGVLKATNTISGEVEFIYPSTNLWIEARSLNDETIRFLDTNSGKSLYSTVLSGAINSADESFTVETFLEFVITNLSISSSVSPISSDVPNWYGKLYGGYGRCDPQQLLRMAQMAGTVAATPTNIGIAVARIAYFRPPADIIVNKLRFWGVGTTVGLYKIAIYDATTLERLTADTAFNTTAATWGSIFDNLNLTLTKDRLYFIAISVSAVGTTAGILCMSPSLATTTGLINILPKSWAGNLDLDLGYMDGGFAQGVVASGVLPNPFPTVAAQAAWTGGFPLIFLDNNNS